MVSIICLHRVYNTWEPKENLLGCIKLLEAFETAYEKKGPSKPRKRKLSLGENGEVDSYSPSAINEKNSCGQNMYHNISSSRKIHPEKAVI